MRGMRDALCGELGVLANWNWRGGEGGCWCWNCAFWVRAEEVKVKEEREGG